MDNKYAAYIGSIPQEVDLKGKPVKEVKEVKAEKQELSENIRKYDEKVAKKQVSPYDYNSVALNKPIANYTPTVNEVINNPVYNTVGKLLGVGIRDWPTYYDKVKYIADWAKKEAGTDDMEALNLWITDMVNHVPQLGFNQKKISQLYTYAVLQMQKGEI